MQVSVSSLTPEALARLYNQPGYNDPADVLEDYQRVQKYCARNPEAGRTHVGNALELPPERVRGWMDGGQPDCVRAIDKAHAKGWLNPDRGKFSALNTLVALVFSAGSINELYVPAFTPEREKTATDALNTLGVRRRRRNEDSEKRATEILPKENGPVLGRVLVLLGAPQGEKAPNDRLHLPDYLDTVDASFRREFAEILLRNRRIDTEERNVVGIREQRTDAYLDELAGFLSDVFDVEITRSEKNLYLQEDPLS